jgi:hypothetical protein
VRFGVASREIEVIQFLPVGAPVFLGAAGFVLIVATRKEAIHWSEAVVSWISLALLVLALAHPPDWKLFAILIGSIIVLVLLSTLRRWRESSPTQ